jgi:hypothetical protein
MEERSWYTMGVHETLKQALVERFSDKLHDQYYTRLQDAVQGRDESAEEFGDR